MRDKISLGSEAREILESDAFKAAVTAVRQELIAKWVSSPPGIEYADARDILHVQLGLVADVVSKLRAVANAGEREKVKLDG